MSTKDDLLAAREALVNAIAEGLVVDAGLDKIGADLADERVALEVVNGALFRAQAVIPQLEAELATTRADVARLDGALQAIATLVDSALAQLPEDPGPDPDPDPDPVLVLPGQAVPRHERIPPFNLSGAVRIAPDLGPVEAVVARYGPETSFLVEPGDYQVSDIRALRGMYFLSREGATRTRFRGQGPGYGFRAKSPDEHGVTIGGLTLEGFCEGSTNALAAAVSPRWADTLFRTSEPDWYGGQSSGWVLHDSILLGRGKAPNGFSMGNNGAMIRSRAEGFTKTGVGVDRIGGGGLIDGCLLTGNGLDPALGAYSDGADAKLVFPNGYDGVTQVEPAAKVPPRAEFLVRDTIFRAVVAGTEGGRRGLWFDLDGQQARVSGCEFHGYLHAGLVFELCTSVVVEDSLFQDCGGFGRPLGDDFVAGAITFGETCHGVARRNRFVRCGVNIAIRESNRTIDMLRPTQRQYDINYAWRANQSIGRYWISDDYRNPNPVGTMSNLATGEIDVYENTADTGRILINAGSIKNGQDPQAAMRVLARTLRFARNQWGPNVRVDELDRSGMDPATWKAWGAAQGLTRG